MLPEQKRAWFVIVVFLAAVAGVIALIPFAGIRAWSALGVFGLAGLTPLLFRGGRESGEVASDERDEMILKRATLMGFGASYVWFVLGCMGAWAYSMLRGRQTIRIDVLPFVVVFGLIVCFVTRAAGILYLYREHGADGEDPDNE